MGVLSENDRLIFNAVASAAAGETVYRNVSGAAERVLQHLNPIDRRLMPLLLRSVQYGPLLTGWGGAFTSLDLHQRQQYLESWASSRMKLRRQGAAALRALGLLCWYGDERAWQTVGYDGPWLGRVEVPVLATASVRSASTKPLSAPGVTTGRRVTYDLRIRVQACVIGTGAGGAAALARLAESGVDALAVEMGGHHTAASFNQKELDMMPMLFQEAAMRANADKSIGILQGKGVGGSTLHNTGLVYEPPPAILDLWRREHGFDIDPPRLDACVQDAIRTLRAIPIPHDQINANNQVLRDGCERLGWKYRIPLHNRSECCGCGYCILGCAYNRKNSALLTYIPRAVAAGARILSDARVDWLRRTRGGWRITCRLFDHAGQPTGRRALIEASVLLVAAGAIDTPALLLRNGLGGGRIGSGLHLHPAALVAAVFDRTIEAWRGLPQSVIIEQFASFYEDGRGGWLGIALAGAPGLSAMLVPEMGAAHRDAMRDLPRVASAAVMLHDHTCGRVRVSLAGAPVARYWPQRRDLHELHEGIRHLARLYLAQGAKEVRLPYLDCVPVRSERALESQLSRARPVAHRMLLNSVHPQGTCPIGASRRSSAVDPTGSVWGERNLFVADASLFCTSIGVPPQVTVMALATAVADHAATVLR